MNYSSFKEAAESAAQIAAELDIPIYVIRKATGWGIDTFPVAIIEDHPDDLDEFDIMPINFFGGFIGSLEDQDHEEEYEDAVGAYDSKRSFDDETEELQSIMRSLRIAAESGDCRSALKLGKIHLFRQDFNAALLRFKIAAKELPEACMEIADMYDFGRGVRANNLDVLIWTEAAAKLGDIEAMVAAAMLHLDTDIQVGERESGIFWLKSAALLGSDEAKNTLNNIDT